MLKFKNHKLLKKQPARISGEIARQQSRLAQIGTIAQTGTTYLQ